MPPLSQTVIPTASSYFKITLRRSTIGLPSRLQGVLRALGLKKRMAIVFHPVSQNVAGQIMKVKELVAVEEVDTAYTKAEMKDMRRPEPGYYIERRRGEGIWNQAL
jgi:large subunit ribosomal protein L30